MENNEKPNTTTEEEQKKEPVKQEKKSPIKRPKSNEPDFKRKYFEYYDDIKISDRQDW